MAGRKPKPTILHELHGNPRKQSNALMQARKALEPPLADHLESPFTLTEAQRQIWRDAIETAPPGVLRRIDLMALRVWVIACDLHIQACEAQAKNPLLVKVSANPDVLPQQSPLLAIINRQGVMMLKAAEQLGFTPVSRPRLLASGVLMAPSDLNSASVVRRPVTIDEYLSHAPPRPGH